MTYYLLCYKKTVQVSSRVQNVRVSLIELKEKWNKILSISNSTHYDLLAIVSKITVQLLLIELKERMD